MPDPVTENDVKLFVAIVGSELSGIDKLAIDSSTKSNRLNFKETFRMKQVGTVDRETENRIAESMAHQNPEFSKYIEPTTSITPHVIRNSPPPPVDDRQLELGLVFHEPDKKQPPTVDKLINMLTTMQNDINYLKNAVCAIKLVIDNPKQRKPYTRRPKQETMLSEH